MKSRTDAAATTPTLFPKHSLKRKDFDDKEEQSVTKKPCDESINTLFIDAISEFIKKCAHPSLQPVHYGEILRALAVYHDEKFNLNRSGQPVDVLKHALHLYEKADVLAPSLMVSIPLCQHRSFVKRNPLLENEARPENMTPRKNHYKARYEALGASDFLWESVNRYLDVLTVNYGTNAKKEFAAILNYLSGSTIIQNIALKHTFSLQTEEALNTFVHVADVILPREQTFKPF